MTRIHRGGLTLGAILAVGMLGGCFSSNKVAFTNVSDSWLNVRFFVHDPGQQFDENGEPLSTPAFVSQKRLQIEPGETARYSVTSGTTMAYQRKQDMIVHIQVEPVTPSWQPTGREYWLEMLTPPPLTIVASGQKDDLKFDSGQGALAVIPEQAMNEGQFEHRIVTAPTDQR